MGCLRFGASSKLPWFSGYVCTGVGLLPFAIQATNSGPTRIPCSKT